MPRPYNDAVMTAAGTVLLDRVRAGLATIEFTRMATGDGIYTADEKVSSALRESTGLKSGRNSYALSSVSTVPGGGVKLTALFTDQDPVTGEVLVTEGYHINEIGLYAKEKGADGSTEVLYSIAVATGDIGDYMPAYTDGAPVQIVQEYRAKVGDAAEVSITSTGAVMLAEDAEKRFSAIEEAIEGTSRGPIEDETPVFEQAEEQENIASGDSLGTILGKVKKFFTDLKRVAFTGSYNDLTDKPDIPSMPDILPASPTGEFERIGKDTFVAYPQGGSMFQAGDKTGSLYIVIPVDPKNFVISFDVHIAKRSTGTNPLSSSLCYHIYGKVKDTGILWERFDADCTSRILTSEYANRPVRFGYVPSKDKAAIRIGEDTSTWGDYIVQVTNVMYFRWDADFYYDEISKGWEVYIDADNDFTSNMENDWLDKQCLSPNVITAVYNMANALSGNLLLGTLLSVSDFYNEGYWFLGGNSNFNNEDPFGGHNAFGLYVTRAYCYIYTTDLNKPIKETGRRYRLSVWLKADRNISCTLALNRTHSVIINVTTEWKRFELVMNSDVTSIAPDNQVQIVAGDDAASGAYFLYIFCPKVEYI